jgi:hypothetical protein
MQNGRLLQYDIFEMARLTGKRRGLALGRHASTLE